MHISMNYSATQSLCVFVVHCPIGKLEIMRITCNP